jgi:flagellar biosynthesis chaperone FliJ
LLNDLDFYEGYRQRLEEKLQHKIRQIHRTERLLQTLPDDQKPAFETLLEQAKRDQNEIQTELDELLNRLDDANQT